MRLRGTLLPLHALVLAIPVLVVPVLLDVQRLPYGYAQSLLGLDMSNTLVFIYDKLDFILFINSFPCLIFFGNGDLECFECLLKNEIIAFPAALLNLYLVTKTIKSA